MGPRRSSNYGTFVAPPGCCTEEAYRDGGNPAGVGHSEIAPAFSTHTVEYHILTLGLRLMKQGAEVVISEMDDDVARARGLCEGDVVTHIDGEPLLGSVKAGHSLIAQAGESLALRIQSGDGTQAGAGTLKKGKYRVVQHIVRQGDSVKDLAKLYGVTADEVRLWNRKYFPVGEPGFLCPGQVLTLRDTAVDQARGGKKSISHQTSQGSNASRRKPGGDGGRKRMLYQVREGDSLKTICARFNLKEGEVRGLNRSVFPIGEPGMVCPGQMLTVFAEECNSLISEEGSEHSATEESERAFMQSLAGRETRRSFMSVGIRGAGVIG